MDMRKLILVGLAIGISWLVYEKAVERPYEPPPSFNAAMEHFAKEAKSDWSSQKGEDARIACRRIAGVSVPANTGMDIIGAGYSQETAIKFSECVVNHMYPVDAKKDKYNREKAGIR